MKIVMNHILIMLKIFMQLPITDLGPSFSYDCLASHATCLGHIFDEV